MIETAISIIDEYEAEGYDLTVRQLYYQFVARDLIPNTLASYCKLASTVNNARLAGLIDWDSITDRTRKMEENSHWEDPGAIIETCANQFRLDTRSTQDKYIEVWVEKDALVGVVERVCREQDVAYLSCRGFASQSAMWRAAQRLIEEEDNDKETIIIQLSDHDPSGIDMTRDIQDRLELFESNVEVERIALTMAQIEEYGPPPNPAKVTDTRYEAYQERYGDDSWELDALDPRVIASLIEEAVNRHTDSKERDDRIELEQQYKDRLQELAENWDSEDEYNNN